MENKTYSNLINKHIGNPTDNLRKDILKLLDEAKEYWQKEQGGLRWIDIEPGGKRPKQEHEIFWDGGENPPSWGRYRKKGKFEYVVLLDSSGEEELYPITDYTRFLDESGSGNEQEKDEWISVNDDLPPETTVVLAYNPLWVDEDFEPEGIREAFYNDEMWNSARWNNMQDTWDNDTDTKPTHWKRRPAPPKQ